MYKLQEQYLQVACTTITSTIRTTTIMRGPSYTKDEITLLHSLHAKYGRDWADIQRVFNTSPSFKRSIKSLQSRYYLKQRQSQKEENVRGPPVYYFAS